jgi:two-component system CheB/CheR fusion protein
MQNTPRPDGGRLRTFWRSLRNRILKPVAPPQSTPVRYALAPAVTVLAAVVQYALLPEPAIAPFGFFYFAVALASWAGGRGPGLLCVALSALVANYLFLSPSVSAPALTSTALFFCGSGAVALLCAAFRNALVAAQRMSQDLKRQADLLRLTHEAIFAWRLTGTIESWNRGAQDLYGFGAGEALGRDVHELLQTRLPHPFPLVEAVLREQGSWEGELEQRTKDGRPLVLAAKMQLVRGEDGIERVLESARDTTDRRQAEALLRESEERFRLAVESAQLGVWDFDPVSGRLDWSPRCKAIFGVPLDMTMSYEAFLQAVHPEDRRRTEELVQHALAQPGGPYISEYRCVWPDGTVRWIAARGEAQFSNVGGTLRAVRMLGTALDITERKRAEEALREANRKRSEFLGVLSHELRNPLAPIRNALYILRHAPEGSEHASRAKVIIERQTNQLTRLVDDLLDITRMSRGKIRLRRRRVDLTALVRHAVEDHRPVYDPRHIALSLRVEVAPLWIDADATRITQTIGNLLQNAVKFTNANGHVAVSVERAGPSRASIRIADDGIGIAPEVLPRIFEPFTQADESLHRSFGGLGLGLALVKELVDRHGGRVEARSQGLGRGSEFTVSLPLVADMTEALHVPPAARRMRTARRRVLVIEDSVDTAETLREALVMGHHEVAVAHDGEEGLATARVFKPDVVLCDIGLPGVDGYEVARRIRADPALSPRLIALTGYALPEEQRRALEAGFHQHLAKPFEIAELEEVLARTTAQPAERRVLVVDDNDALRSNIREMLEDEDWEVQEARGGAEALDVVARFAPAVILLDYRMPNMGGEEVLRRLRASNEAARVVLMTASADVRQLAFEHGLRLYVPKPFASQDLIGTLEQAIADVGLQPPPS